MLDAWLADATAQWNGEPGFYLNAPSARDDPDAAAQFTRFLRLAASPAVGYTTRQVLHAVDVRGILESIHAPTLVVHRRGDRMIRADHGRFLAAHIPDARFVELPGDDHLFYFGDADAILVEIEEFLTGVRHVDVGRTLATVLFTDIVGSSARGRRRSAIDDGGTCSTSTTTRSPSWSQLRGHVVKTTGDGVLATFDGPGRALRCAARHPRRRSAASGSTCAAGSTRARWSAAATTSPAWPS